MPSSFVISTNQIWKPLLTHSTDQDSCGALSLGSVGTRLLFSLQEKQQSETQLQTDYVPCFNLLATELFFF